MSASPPANLAIPKTWRPLRWILGAIGVLVSIEVGLRMAEPTAESAPATAGHGVAVVWPTGSPSLAVVGGASTYAVLDSLDDILAQRPDVVVIAAGHDEYYGAYGVMDAPSLVGAPAIARLLIAFDRLRLLRWLRRGSRPLPSQEPRPIANYPVVTLASPRYRSGLTQFAENLDAIVAKLQRAKVRIFVATPVSNLRDQPPLAEANRTPLRSARSAFGTGVGTLQAAHEAFARGDSSRGTTELAAAKRAFVRARDLDPIRLRAPSAFDSIVRAVALRRGVTVLELERAFDAAAEDGIPGRDLFLDHVRLSPRGAVLLGRTICEALGAPLSTPAPAGAPVAASCGPQIRPVAVGPND